MSDELSQRETYLLSMVAANGGEIRPTLLRHVVLQRKRPFDDIGERYLKYSLLPKTLQSLTDRRLLQSSGTFIRTTRPLEDLLAQLGEMFAQASEDLGRYRRDHMLEFDLIDVERYIFDGALPKGFPYEAVTELEEAVQIFQSGLGYDAVILKCGKCVELLVERLNKQHGLLSRRLRAPALIRQFIKDETVKKFSTDPDQRDKFRQFAHSSKVLYDFRSKMGAHAVRSWEWGKDRISLMALGLSFYLVDLYIYDLHQ